MYFVLIAEPDEVNAESIRAILDSVDKNFTYEITDSAEGAIELIENRRPDIFIGDMQMPVITGTELFSMAEMISPDTIRIVMTEVSRIPETVAFMNECRTFKVIMKPCRIADDLLTPIQAAIEYKEMKKRIDEESAAVNMGNFSTQNDYERMERAAKETLEESGRVQNIFTELLTCNLKLGRRPRAVQETLEGWYRWMMEIYIRNIMEASDDYEENRDRVMLEWNHPEKNYTLKIRKILPEPIAAAQMNEMMFILELLTGLCQRILESCSVSAVIETVEKAYILRYSCTPEIGPYREKDREVRDALIRATEKGVDALGYKSALLPKENEIIFNIALRR